MSETIKYGYGSPRWTGEIADCSLPLTFDTYSNCSLAVCTASHSIKEL